MNYKKIVNLLLSSLCFLSLSGCKNSENNNDYFHIETNDKEFDEFYNEFYLRHVRERDYACNDLALGYGSLYMKEWESRSLVWHDNTPLSGDRLGKLKYYITDFPIDKFGVMWSTSYALETSGPVTNYNVCNAFAQGWPIPNYVQANGKNIGFEFNTDDDWTVQPDNLKRVNSDGMYIVRGEVDSVSFNSPLLNKGNGYETFYCPFVALDVRVTDFDHYDAINNIEDIYFCWQTVEGGDTWYEVSQKEYSTMPETEIGSFFARRMFFPMYLNENWGLDKHVKNVKVEVRMSTKSFIEASLNYCRLDFDTRQSNNNTLFLCYANEYFKYNNDVELMRKNLTKFRKMMTFLLNHLKGKDGLIDISYFVGHDGIGYQDMNTPSEGHGIGNGYWDIYAAPALNIDANTYFYKSLLAMAELEDRAAAYGLSIPVSEATVTSPQMDGTVTYNMDSASLRELANTCKTKFQNTFWNQETGRFYYGDVTGLDGITRKIDYGYVQFNTEAITAGLASPEQERSIMSWLNGDRIVLGDDSCGDDIYFFEFGPRSTTKNNVLDYSITWTELFVPFGEQVQNGGAILYVSFYDVFSRNKILGLDNAFARMSEIKDWYLKVKEAGGEGSGFYADYYFLNTNIKVQGGGQLGAVGLDNEFLEDAMLYDYIPECLLNLDASEAFNLKIAPKLPTNLKYLNVYNLRYDGIVYDLKIKGNKVEICNVRGNTEGRYVTITSPNGKSLTKEFSNFKVK